MLFLHLQHCSAGLTVPVLNNRSAQLTDYEGKGLSTRPDDGQPTLINVAALSPRSHRMVLAKTGHDLS